MVGSFLNVCIYRLPEDMSIVFPSSHCRYCNTNLRWYENIPILSYCFLKGKCRTCGVRISIQYPIVECITGIGFIALYGKFHLSFMWVLYAYFFSCLVIVTFTDLNHQIIPDSVTLSGIVVGLVSTFLLGHMGFGEAVLGSLVGGGILYLVGKAWFLLAHCEGMGGGDIKLMAMVGAILGWQQASLIIMLASFLGSVIGLVLILGRKKGLKDKLPFGVFLAMAAVVAVFFGKEIIGYYLFYIRVNI